MNCPKCYGKVDKISKQCKYCGFKLKELVNASNKEAKKAIKNGDKEDVLFTSILPNDVNKKKLKLYSIFLGLLGWHDLYVGKYGSFIFKFITFFAQIIIFCLKMLLGNQIVVLQYISTISSFLMGINIFLWFYDVIRIFTGKYKVPVYKEEFSE